MSRITKIEFNEVDRSIKNKYIILQENNLYFIEHELKGSLNKSFDKIEISSDEYELITNHLLKYYKILSWKNTYDNKDYSINKNEWSLTIYEENILKKEIVGNNNFPKNFNSFKNYIMNKYNTNKI